MAGKLVTAPQPSVIRDELLKAVLGDLLGPAGGPDEEVNEARVRDRYLVGMLAPKRQVLMPEQFDELAIGTEDGPEEGTPDFTAPQATTLFPSSFGMTFCVSGEAKALKVTVRWGQYDRVESAILQSPKTGEPKMVWKRRQITQALEIPLKRQTVRMPVNEEFRQVEIQGIVRDQDGT